MDEEANQLLREIRDSAKQIRTVVWLILACAILLAVSLFGWEALSRGQTEKDYERGFKQGHDAFREQLRKRIEDRKKAAE